MKKWPKLAGLIDKIFIDNMNEQFNSLTGAWPESYFFADKSGKCIWKSKMDDSDGQYQVFNEAFKFAFDQGLAKIKDGEGQYQEKELNSTPRSYCSIF